MLFYLFIKKIANGESDKWNEGYNLAFHLTLPLPLRHRLELPVFPEIL